jgi:hypothetical protein
MATIWAMTEIMSEEDRPRVQINYPRIAGDGPAQAIYIGAGKDGWRDAYHFLLTMPLPMFLGVMAAGFIGINTLFALA